MMMTAAAAGAVIALTAFANAEIQGAVAPRAAAQPRVIWAQAMVPPTGMEDAQRSMPMQERMQRRFPQPVRVGDLIGLPVLDHSATTLGYVREVTLTSANNIELIVSYSRWFGWFGWLSRPVAVPIEVVGIEGRQLMSLDMAANEYAAAPTWQSADAKPLPDDATIRIALARN